MITLIGKTPQPQRAETTLHLPWEKRVRSRLRVRLDNGEEAGLFLPHGTVLRGGDTLISADELAAAQKSGTPPLVLDCSFELTDPQAGQRAYEAGHIPGARYVHLDQVLSAAKTGRNGRHPLPSRETFATAMAAMGLDAGMQVVACDNASGMFAARLWWMLRWAGHRAVAVLDGGIAAWTAAGHPLSQGAPMAATPGSFRLQPSLVATVTYDEVKATVGAVTGALGVVGLTLAAVGIFLLWRAGKRARARRRAERGEHGAE